MAGLDSDEGGLSLVQALAIRLRAIPVIKFACEEEAARLDKPLVEAAGKIAVRDGPPLNRAGPAVTDHAILLLLAEVLLHGSIGRAPGPEDFLLQFRTGLKLCVRCRRPFYTPKRRSKLCRHCPPRVRRQEMEARRQLKRRFDGGGTGTTAVQKQDARLLDAMPRPNLRTEPRAVDREIDAALRTFGTPAEAGLMGRRHCQDGVDFVNRRNRLIRFLRQQPSLRPLELRYRKVLHTLRTRR